MSNNSWQKRQESYCKNFDIGETLFRPHFETGKYFGYANRRQRKTVATNKVNDYNKSCVTYYKKDNKHIEFFCRDFLSQHSFNLFQVLKMDTVMIIWIIIWGFIALCLPFGVAAYLCCPNKRQRLNEDFSIGSENSTGSKTEKLFGVFLHILLAIFL